MINVTLVFVVRNVRKRGKNLKEKLLLKCGYQIKMFFSPQMCKKLLQRWGRGVLKFFERAGDTLSPPPSLPPLPLNSFMVRKKAYHRAGVSNSNWPAGRIQIVFEFLATKTLFLKHFSITNQVEVQAELTMKYDIIWNGKFCHSPFPCSFPWTNQHWRYFMLLL